MARGHKRGATTVSPEANAACPAHSRQLPACYHERAGEGDSDGDEGEYIDPNPLDGTSSESSNDVSQCAEDSRHPPNSTTRTLATTITDPLVTNRSSKGRNVAHDIHHFFRKEKDAMVCKPCK